MVDGNKYAYRGRFNVDVSHTLTDNATGYAANLLPALSRVVNTAGFAVEAHAKAAIKTGPKTGRKYTLRAKKGSRNTKGRFRKSGTAIVHQASAEGEAPASLSGGLAADIHNRLDAPGALSTSVTAGKEYAAHLEDDMNRPFMAPAAEAVQPVLNAAVATVLKGKKR